MDPITITQALNTIQSWLNAGEFDKVIQGCQEVLKLDPGNSRASSLMRQAEDRRFLHQTPSEEPTLPTPMPETTPAPEPMPMQMPEPMPAPMPEPTPEPTPAPTYESTPKTTHELTPQNDPLANLQVEATPVERSHFQRPFTGKIAPLNRAQRFFAMALPALFIIVIGGLGLTAWTIHQRNQTIEEALSPNQDEISNTSTAPQYLENNQKRMADLKKIGEILEAYSVKNNGRYPSVESIRALIESEGVTPEISDPRQGEVDKAGRPFGYLYAVYDGEIGGPNSYYIVSALFEDSLGFGSPWSIGAPIRKYPNYRDLSAENVTFIAPSHP